MATLAENLGLKEQRPDLLSGTPRAHAIDRWIFVGMALWFIAIVLAGFIPDSIAKVAAVQTGLRPPFPIVLHMHALVMGSFLLVLLAQSTLMATGRRAYHMQLGVLGFALAAVLVVIGFVLAPTMYHQVWHGAQIAPPATREKATELVGHVENILLLQIEAGVLFAVFAAMAFRARGASPGIHKRMMFLAVAVALPAAFNRMDWLPETMPGSPLSLSLYTLVAISPMFLWDVIRNRAVHPAYVIWFVIWLPFAIAVSGLWNTPWWHHTAKVVMGVA